VFKIPTFFPLVNLKSNVFKSILLLTLTCLLVSICKEGVVEVHTIYLKLSEHVSGLSTTDLFLKNFGAFLTQKL
jgi:hypothetical protein